MKQLLIAIGITFFIQPDREIVYSQEVTIYDCQSDGEIKILGKDDRIYVIPIKISCDEVKPIMPIKRID